MLSTYTVLETVHLLAVIVWLGGAVMFTILALRARAQGPERLVTTFRDLTFVAPRTFVPASLVLVVTGFGLIASGDLPYDTWIVLAIIGWVITFLAGVAVLTPQTKKAEALIEQHGPTSDTALAQVQRVLMLARIDLVILALVVIDMVIKPA